MIQSDVLCSVWFERKLRKIQSGKTDTESGLRGSANKSQGRIKLFGAPRQ